MTTKQAEQKGYMDAMSGMEYEPPPWEDALADAYGKGYDRGCRSIYEWENAEQPSAKAEQHFEETTRQPARKATRQ